ncbi:MAG: hypothetical protein INR65_14635, partial [Gluconacetobacter diazotrophicus]|nr:hypothetical protein [Gluconacetobacter diazotrophicus]
MHETSPARRDHCLVSFDGRIVQMRNGEPFCERIAASVRITSACEIDADRMSFRRIDDGEREARTGLVGDFRIDRGGTVPPGHFRITCRGRSVFAGDDGRLLLGMHGQSTFFTLVRHDTVALGLHILRNSWIEPGREHVLEPRDIRAEEGPSLSLDGERILFSELESSCLARGNGGDGEPKDLAIRYSGWKVRRLILFKPLIYMAAFGPQGLFDCAELAIE